MPKPVGTPDVCVVGCGSFGAFAALTLRRRGASVHMIDSFGPGNTRQSSGGETRLIRAGYGADVLYTKMAARSLEAWKALAAETGTTLFEETGVCWIGRGADALLSATLATLRAESVEHAFLDAGALARRLEHCAFDAASWGVLEPRAGVIFARRAVQAAAARSVALGATFTRARAAAPAGHGRCDALTLNDGTRVRAGAFVFAAGPWLGKVFPDILGRRIFPTRQEVFYFGVPAGDARFSPPAMPAFIDFGAELYGVPDLEGRGFKIAIDRHGPPFDPDGDDRTITPAILAEVRAYAASRFPALAGAPLVAAEVCQYENTSNGDFVIDRHPDFDNVWIAGGGSGHGFKHGPAVGETVAALIGGAAAVEPRFSLASKGSTQRRAVW